MSSTWTCKFSYDAVSLSNNDPGNPSTLYGNYDIHMRMLSQPVADPIPKYNPAVDYGHISVVTGVLHDGRSFLGVTLQGGSNEINEANWFSVEEATGNADTGTIFGAFSDFANGGTVVVT